MRTFHSLKLLQLVLLTMCFRAFSLFVWQSIIYVTNAAAFVTFNYTLVKRVIMSYMKGDITIAISSQIKSKRDAPDCEERAQLT